MQCTRGRYATAVSGPVPAHEFSYRVAMPLLYLDEVDYGHAACTRCGRARRPSPVRFRRADFLGDPGHAARPRPVRDLVEERYGLRPAGPVALLANLRTWGWLFNPISLYFCSRRANGPDGPGRGTRRRSGEHALAREALLRGRPARAAPVREVHARVTISAHGRRLRAAVHGPGRAPHGSPGRAPTAPNACSGSPWRCVVGHSTAARWGDCCGANPALTHRVSAGIYSQAARLGLRGAPFHAHPARRSPRL